jgi:hypothetical protein
MYNKKYFTQRKLATNLGASMNVDRTLGAGLLEGV